MYQRKPVATIVRRLKDAENPFIQIIVGPRQTGKTTMVLQAVEDSGLPSRYACADDMLYPNVAWIRGEWKAAREEQRARGGLFVLVLDEVQRVKGWSEVVRELWDEDLLADTPLKVVLSGAPLLRRQEDLVDVLEGRYDLTHCTHWSFGECREAFGFTLNDYLYFGGYPGAAYLSWDTSQWFAYMHDAVLEPTIERDVVAVGGVRKRSLLKALFRLGAQSSNQELPYNRMLGQLQLQGAGSTATLAQYLRLLDGAGMLRVLERYTPDGLPPKRPSPRLMVYDPSLMTAGSGISREALLENLDLRERLIHSAVGAYLLARSVEDGFEVSWWRDGEHQVEFYKFLPVAADNSARLVLRLLDILS